MDALVTKTKILIPRRRPELLSRQRLIELFYDLLDYKLIILSAPAGYGKTSLLVDFAQQADYPLCWYAIEILDRDPYRFITHFIAAVAHSFPSFGQTSTAILQGMARTGLDIERLVTTVVNDAYEHIQEHIILVLDDYHMVDDCSEISQFINSFIQKVDENFHLIIATRKLSYLTDLPLMVARSQTSGLGMKELAFQPKEIQELMLQNYHITISESTARELAQETEGWITGLILSAHTMWDGMVDRIRTARTTGVGLYDYLAQQVLDEQAKPVRDFLLRTSLLEEFNVELCEDVFGEAIGEDWSGLIEKVLRNHLFVQSLDDSGTWLRYHHLFRDFLQTRLAHERPDEETRILKRLLEVFIERESWEKAYNICQRLGDISRTINLIEHAGMSLVHSGRLVLLANWIDALPTEVFSSRPRLLQLRGCAAATLGELDRSLIFLDQAIETYRVEENLPRLVGSLTWRAGTHRFLGNYQTSLADAEEAVALAEGENDLRAAWAEGMKVKGLSLFRLGGMEKAIECLEKSMSTYTALGDFDNAAMVGTDLGMSHKITGDYSRAEDAYRKSLRHWRKTNNITQLANLQNQLGVLLHVKGDYEQAKLSLEESLDCARRSGYTRFEALALASIGDLYSDLGAGEAAKNAYHQSREVALHLEYRFLLFYLHLAEAALERMRGDLSRARDLLETARERSKQDSSNFEEGLYQLEAGRQAQVNGANAEAITQLNVAINNFKQGGYLIELIRACLHLADAYNKSADLENARTYLMEAFISAGDHSIGDHSAYIYFKRKHALVVPGMEMKSFLKEMSNDPAMGERVSELNKEIELFERKIPGLRRRLREGESIIEFGPPKLVIQALGKCQVTIDGKPITNTDWVNHKSVRELLFYMMTKPEGSAKDAIGSVFWAESTPNQLLNQLKNNIYRLRRTLGKEVILFDQNDYLYRFNRGLDYEYDVETFMKKYLRAKGEKDLSQKIEFYNGAVECYGGPYLPDMGRVWVLPERERLWRFYVESMLVLARFYLENEKQWKTLEHSHRLLTEDPCLEAAYRLSMRAYAKMGSQVDIARQYARCKEALWDEHAIHPSAKTKELFERLTVHKIIP